jgi:nitroreductase
MTVAEAVERRISVRAFRPEPVPEEVVRAILSDALRAPSGGNLQPWRVHVLAGDPLAEFKVLAAERMAAGGESPEYAVYPPNLWEPFRGRRFQCGEDLYATIGVAREDKAGRLRQMAQNLNFFGAPVGMFFTLDRRLGPPQWSDVGMYMQTVMLLAVERGLDTCAQEFWSNLPRTVGDFLGLDEHEMLFSGMALGYRDESAPINRLRTRREPVKAVVTMRGF